MKKELAVIAALFFLITSFFFYPVFKGQIPFAGDLLISYPPYSSQGYLGYAPGAVPNKAQGQDSIRESFPWKYFTIDSWKKLQVPFWTPYNFSGNPIMADFQSAVFYPLNIIFFLFPFTISWTIFIFLSPFLASFFMYLFLRELRLSKFGSIFGGVVFGFSSYMTVQMEWGNVTHTFLWLPLSLFFTERLAKKFSIKNTIGLVVTLWFCFLAGYIQSYFYILLIVFFYFLTRNFNRKDVLFAKRKTKFFLFLLFLCLPILLALFQALPTLELFANSTRKIYTLPQIDKLLNPPWYFITVFIPDFFGNPGVRSYWFDGTYIERVSYFGVIPFLLALAAAFTLRSRKEVRFFATLCAITFFAAANFGFTKYFYLLPIPMISTTVPTRILNLFEFSGTVLAAYGWEFFIQGKKKKQFIIAISVGLFLLAISWAFVIVTPKVFATQPWIVNIPITRRNLVIPSIFVLLFIILFNIRFYGERIIDLKYLFLNGKSNKKFFLIGIATGLFILTFVDLFYFFHKITPFSPKAFVYPQTDIVNFMQTNGGINRYWGYGSAYISSNFQTYDKTFSPEGDDPLHLQLYTALITTSRNGHIDPDLSRLDANIAGGYGQDDLRNNKFRKKILDILGVKYIVHKNDLAGSSSTPDVATFDPREYKLVWQEAPWQIYENLHVTPRVFLTDKYRVEKAGDETVRTLLSKNFDESKMIVLNEQVNLPINPIGNASVHILDYQPNTIVLQTNANGNAMLFLSDNYYPGWEATIDGQPAKIYLADYTFRAIPVPKGNHTVIFRYHPGSFDLGWKLSLAVFVLLIPLLFLVRKRKLFIQ